MVRKLIMKNRTLTCMYIVLRNGCALILIIASCLCASVQADSLKQKAQKKYQQAKKWTGEHKKELAAAGVAAVGALAAGAAVAKQRSDQEKIQQQEEYVRSLHGEPGGLAVGLWENEPMDVVEGLELRKAKAYSLLEQSKVASQKEREKVKQLEAEFKSEMEALRLQEQLLTDVEKMHEAGKWEEERQARVDAQ